MHARSHGRHHGRLAFLAAVVIAVSGTGVVAAADPIAGDPPVVFDGTTARVAFAGGRALAPAAGSPLGTATTFLAGRGYDARTLASLRVDAQFGIGGLSHLALVQEVDGRRVAGAYAKLAFDATGALVHAIDALVPVPAAVAAGPAGAESNAIGPEMALTAAMRAVIPQVADRPAVAARERGVATFQRTPAFYAAPTATEVLLARQSGRLERAWQVTTWTGDENLLDVTIVDGAGAVAATERRTAHDSYVVFAKYPGKSAQVATPGPGPGNAQSPSGWLSGAQRTTNIRGNNANAYLDRDANNAPDSGGTAVDNSAFTATFSASSQPDTTNNQAVAVQNLFYLTNYTHDLLYRFGFTEGTRNFQVNNFGKGGLGNDPVNAEAQDGSGMDNANFATPVDGSSPRMQMYLWSSPDPNAEIALASPSATVPAYAAAFGPKPTSTGVSGTLVMVNDRTAPTGDGCEAMAKGSLNGKLVIVDRGLCAFVDKVKNVQAAGGVGVVIVNNVEGRAFAMGGTASLRIPAVMVDLTGGSTLKTRAAGTQTASSKLKTSSTTPIRLDGDLDSDIVYHEYGHGLTSRVIGGMSGPMAGAIGEGASDALSIFVNQDDRIGEYSVADPIGIRRAPYALSTMDYSAMTGLEVHDDGELYGRIAWLLLRGYLDQGLTLDDLLASWVGGMALTASGPTMTSMRDGMVAAATKAATSSAKQVCLVWRAFAQAGVGQGASATVSGGRITAITSKVVPTGVAGACTAIDPIPAIYPVP